VAHLLGHGYLSRNDLDAVLADYQDIHDFITLKLQAMTASQQLESPHRDFHDWAISFDFSFAWAHDATFPCAGSKYLLHDEAISFDFLFAWTHENEKSKGKSFAWLHDRDSAKDFAKS
jgi:hypothetical protein